MEGRVWRGGGRLYTVVRAPICWVTAVWRGGVGGRCRSRVSHKSVDCEGTEDIKWDLNTGVIAGQCWGS